MDKKVYTILLVIDLPQEDVISVLQESLSLCRFGFELEVMVRSESVGIIKRFLPEIDLIEFEQLTYSYNFDKISAVLAVPVQDTITRLALGLQDRKPTQLILQSLWLGIPVFMDASVAQKFQGRTCANDALKSLYERYVNNIQNLGVKNILPGEYLNIMRNEFLVEEQHQMINQASIQEQKNGRIFITYKDIMKIADDNTELELPHGATLTSLAVETVRKRGIILKQKEVRD